ncbi:MAG TPA: hypothetical protein DCP47_02575 [Phycisphaerales bacterium]|nr:hypothetical protein [Phycisphaerales bacterium]
MWNLFEYPFVGIGIGLITFIGFWIFRVVWPSKKRRWQYFVPLAIYIAAFAVAYFVQTDNEKITATINKGISAFQKNQIEPIREIISDDYSDSLHSSKEIIVAYCQALFQTITVDKVTFLSKKSEIKNNRAMLTIEAMVKFAEQSQIAQMGKPFLIVKGRFSFVKTADKKWVINSSEILELDRQPIDWDQIPK